MGMHVSQSGALEEDFADYRPMAEINITPFVDVMLVLLIIFMVTAPLLVAGVPLQLPKSSAAKLTESKKPMIVSMKIDGSLYIRKEPVADAELVQRLREMKAAEGDAVVYVRADTSIAYGKVMEILGRVGQGGYARVSLLSHKTTGGTPQPSAGGN